MKMPILMQAIEGRRLDEHHGCPRVIVDHDGWRLACEALAAGRWALLGLWGDTHAVHMSVLDQPQANANKIEPNHNAHSQTDQSQSSVAVLSLDCLDGRFPSVGAVHAPAIRCERAIRSLFGLEPVGLPDPRPWLDLGFWGCTHPLGTHAEATAPTGAYVFLPAHGEALHQIPVGPVHAGIIEPGHFRFTASGETVVRLEQRLGYVHKGIEKLMAGATIDKASRLAGRTCGDSAVAYALAFARAVEAALDTEVPSRAAHLRALMAELERLANHFGDIGTICNDASFSIMHAQCGILREQTLRVADTCFGHRLMMDCVVPGGTTFDLSAAGSKAILALTEQIKGTFPRLVELYDNTASLQDRTAATGILPAALARTFAAGGYVGRASGRDFDARRRPGYAPYDELEFEVPVLTTGDVDARVWVRIREVEQSLRLIDQIVRSLPAGSILSRLDSSPGTREGFAVVEGFRGDVLAWIRIEHSRVARCHLRDPSWFQWPLLEAAIEGNIVADFPLCNKSFNCSYSGHDL